MPYEKTQYSEQYAPYFFKEYWPQFQPIQVSSPESKEINLLWTDLKAHIDSFVASAVISGLDDAAWDAHVQQCNALDYQKIMDYYQKQYDSIQEMN